MTKKKLSLTKTKAKRSFWAYFANALGPHDEIIRRAVREVHAEEHSEEPDKEGVPLFSYTRPVKHLGNI